MNVAFHTYTRQLHTDSRTVLQHRCIALEEMTAEGRKDGQHMEGRQVLVGGMDHNYAGIRQVLYDRSENGNKRSWKVVAFFSCIPYFFIFTPLPE